MAFHIKMGRFRTTAALALIAVLAGFSTVRAENNAGDPEDRVRRLFEEGFADEARKAANWEQILKIAPDSEYALFIRAEGLDSYKKQIAMLDRALKINPRFFEAYLERARAKAELERLSDALGDVNRALELRPDDFGAHIDRGDYLQRGGRFSAALGDFARALAFARDAEERGLALLFRGETQLEMGNAPGAIKTADEALALLKNNPQLLYLRGRARIKAGRRKEGCADLERAIRGGEDLARMQKNEYCAGAESR